MHPVLFDASVTKYSYTWSTLFPFDLSSILALSMNISLDWACDNNCLNGLFLCITVSGDAIVKTDHVALIAFG